MTTRYESTIRMTPELAQRLDIIAQVEDKSKNQFIVEAIAAIVKSTEEDPNHMARRREWLKRLQRAAV